MKISTLFFAVLPAAAPFLAGQTTIVHPKALAGLEGNWAQASPLGLPLDKGRGLHYLQVDDLLPSKDIRIKGMAFRPDGTMNRPWSSFQVELDLRLSTARRRGSLVNAWFEANQTKDLTTVVSRKTLKFPASQGFASLPAPFLLRLPFDGGKTFRLAAGKELCWDLRIYASTAPGYPKVLFLDGFVRGRGLFTRSVRKGGINPKWGTQVGLQMGDDFLWGYQVIQGSIFQGPIHGRAFLFLGTRLLSRGIPFGGWKSVFYLDPLASPLILGPFREQGGNGYYSFGIPSPPGNGASLLGRPFYAQGVVVGSTPAETCGTNTLECLFTIPWYSTLPGSGNVMLAGRDGLVSPTGKATPDAGVVVQYKL